MGEPQAVRLLSILKRHCFLLLLLNSRAHGSDCYLTSTCDQGCVFIKEAYQVYWSSCVKGIHSGQMVLKVVEAIGEMFIQRICSCSVSTSNGLCRGNACLWLVAKLVPRASMFCRCVSCWNSHADIWDGSLRAVHQQYFQRCAFRLRSCPQGIIAVWDVRFEGNTSAQLGSKHFFTSFSWKHFNHSAICSWTISTLM